jgi:hypothetical protein
MTYTGYVVLQRYIDVLKTAGRFKSDLLLASTAPASLEVYRSNERYSKDEDFVFALAEALCERIEHTCRLPGSKSSGVGAPERVLMRCLAAALSNKPYSRLLISSLS